MLEERILQTQKDVVKSKKKYNALTAILKQLLDKKQLIKAKVVMGAISKVLLFILRQ